MAAFAEDTAQDAGEGEDELAVGNFVADRGGDPFAGGADAALVAGGAEVAGLAGEGEEALVPAVGALEAGEASGEVTTTEEGLDGGGCGGAGRRTAQRVFIRTISVRIKVGSDGSDMRTIRKGDLTMEWCRKLDRPFRALLFPRGGPRALPWACVVCPDWG